MELTLSARGVSVFVAGGTSGINLGIAEGFARAGARVGVMSRSQDKVDRAVKRLRALGSDATGGAADPPECLKRSTTNSATLTSSFRVRQATS